METIQIQLPTPLAQLIQREFPSSETLSQIFTEALRQWLDRRGEKSEKEKAQDALRAAGLIMPANEQRAFAETLLNTLPQRTGTADLARVRASLAKLKVPLSEEILAMRGER